MLRIRTKRNLDGRVVLNLYGQDFDVTDQIKNGRGEIRLFNQDYIVAVEGEPVRSKRSPRRSRRRRSRAKTTTEPQEMANITFQEAESA